MRADDQVHYYFSTHMAHSKILLQGKLVKKWRVFWPKDFLLLHMFTIVHFTNFFMSVFVVNHNVNQY